MRSPICIAGAVLAVLVLAMLSGCASLTAAEVSNQAMRGCQVTRELHIDTTLTTTSTRVFCGLAREREGER